MTEQEQKPEIKTREELEGMTVSELPKPDYVMEYEEREAELEKIVALAAVEYSRKYG